MSKLEGANKIADDVHFAVIGRAIADAARRGESFEGLANEALLLRQHEQDSADRQVQFARLARQIGDARRSGRDNRAARGSTHGLAPA